MSVLGNPITLGGGGAARKYLVKDGVPVNGNLVALGMKSSSSSSFSAVAPNVVQGTGLVTLGWTSVAPSGVLRAGIVYCNEAVDLSRYSFLYLHGTWKFYATNAFAQANLSYNLWTSLGAYQNENRLLQQPASGLTAPNGGEFNTASKLDTRSILVLDLSTLSSRQNAYVGFNFGNTVSGYTNVKLYDIWLE